MDAKEHTFDGIFHKCFNPSILLNKYDGKEYAVPCRQCLGCLSARSDRLRNMLRNEFLYGPNRFPVFVTFSYAPNHLPMFYRCVDDDGCISPFYISDFGQIVPARLIDEATLPDQSFRDFETHISNHPRYVYSAFASFNVADLQKCFKRLRITIRRRFGVKSDSFRYFFISEYGSRRFRPHYHGFLWCKTQEIQDFILREFDTSMYSETQRNELGLLSLWKLGRTDASVPRQDEAVNSYISSYISCLSASINFTVKGFRPFYICSKAPFIGSNPTELSMLENTLHTSVTDFSRPSSVFDKKASDGQTVTNILYSKSSLYSVFPKCDEFSRLSRSARVEKYSTLQGRSDYEVAYFQDFVYNEVSHQIILQRFGVIDGIRYSVNDIHAMKRCAFYCDKYHISPFRYVEILTDFYTSYYSQLLGLQCSSYSEASALMHSNWYVLDSDLVLSKHLLESASRGGYDASQRAILGSLFGPKIPLPSRIEKHLKNNKFKQSYVEKVQNHVASHVKHRYVNEYDGFTAW